MRDLLHPIQAAVDATFDDLVACFREGVRADSRNPAVGGPGEGAFQARYAAMLQEAGARVESWTVDGDALLAAYPEMAMYVRPGALDGRPNVIGWLPSKEPSDGKRAHVILNSHCDTVGATDLERWRYAPHSAEVADGEVYGLGAVDAKGGLFAFLGAAMALRHAGITLRRPAMIQSVVDEEHGGAGALECVRRGYAATAAIVGEPSELHVCPGSRGGVTFHLEVAGRKAHPGEGWRGVNAIRKAWTYVEALDRLRDALDRTEMHPLWAPLPVGHVWNLMAVNSGPGGRAVPDRCEVVYGAGTIGTERTGAMRARIEAEIARVTASDPWLAEHPPTLSWRGLAMESAVSDPMHPAVGAMVGAGEALGRGPVPVHAMSAATDGRHLVNHGGIPSINFGPGEMRRGHSPSESLPLLELRAATAWVALFLATYCGIDGGSA